MFFKQIGVKPHFQTSPMNIILADDDPDDAFFFRIAVEETGVPASITIAHSSRELLELLDKQPPDILFLDWLLPPHNGYVCLNNIRSRKDTGALPVIIYSAINHQKIVEAAYHAKATRYIVKPASLEELKTTLASVIVDGIGHDNTVPFNHFVLS